MGEAHDPGEVTFLVRFSADHAMARAQNLQQRGQHRDAERLARRLLRRQADLQGLCFERFTLGGAEIVLAACVAPAAHRRRAFQELWVERFAGMAGVDYAEPNLIAQAEG